MIKREPGRKGINSKDGKLKLDVIDGMILRILTEDSRTSIQELSKRVYLSRGAAQRRIDALVNAGVITRFTIEVDRDKMSGRWGDETE